MLRPSKDRLEGDHPTAVAFVDEAGSVARDRFFAVGCLKLAEPSVLTRAFQKLRDQEHWYGEVHWVDLTKDALPFYKKVVDVIAVSDASFSCFVADREKSDPVKTFKTPWRAYEKMATQLLIASVKPREIITVLADNYSTPDDVDFERDVKVAVNARLKRMAVTNVVRLDSRSADPLQLVDLLTGAVAFEYKQSAGLAGASSPKAKLAKYVRDTYGVDSVLDGCKTSCFNVALHGPRKSDPEIDLRDKLSTDTRVAS